MKGLGDVSMMLVICEGNVFRGSMGIKSSGKRLEVGRESIVFVLLLEEDGDVLG